MPRICTDEFHASLSLRTAMRFAGALADQPSFDNSASVPETEGGSGSGRSFAPQPQAGVVAAPNPALKIVTGIEGRGRR